jgi:acyl-CoA thioesterase I
MSGFTRLHDRLSGKAADVTARPVLYVAFGDSVTQGCMEYGTVEHESVFHNLLKKAVDKRFPHSVFSVINSGVSGDTASASRSRWNRDLLMFQPDLVTIGFGVNDAHEGEKGLGTYVESMRELIESVRTQTSADILLLTPNMMIKRDNANVDDRDRPALPLFLKTAEEGFLDAYTESLRELAKQEQVECFDQYDWWVRLERQGVDIHTRLVNGINHPDRDCHRELAEGLEACLFGAPVEKS